ncbi:alpha/beta hydrolase [Pseudonocardia ailaonensis]|uniref:Alpha/beta hydrolase n=1 Tax=Pseudonocardia ailaonensis TaxID=367279 RepID=A0ABN2MZ57_9PSEU
MSTHGFAFVERTFALHDYPGAFADAGFVSLSYDHPCTGESDGLPRQELDPVAQQRGYSDAITYLLSLGVVDPSRIGIWGTSYSGGHVLAVAADDRRVSCVVSQAQTISGRRNLTGRLAQDDLAAMRARWAEDRDGRFAGGEAGYARAGSTDTVAFRARHDPEHFTGYRPEVTVRSYEWYFGYEPGWLVPRIAPTPLLMIVCDGDRTTPTADSLWAYGRAHEPKQLLLLTGGHYAVYESGFAAARDAAVAWFGTHLDDTNAAARQHGHDQEES